MKARLTEVQQNYFDYIVEHLQAHHSMPPMLDVAAQFNVAPNAAHEMFTTLARKGWLASWTPAKSSRKRYKLADCEIVIRTIPTARPAP